MYKDKSEKSRMSVKLKDGDPEWCILSFQSFNLQYIKKFNFEV